jgi:CRP-like cAMP-binding protein
MAQESEDDIANRLLLSLPKASLKALRPALELGSMARSETINRADSAIEHLYFVNRGLISLVKTMRDGRTVEIGVVGIEGISNTRVLFGMNKAALESVVQVPGSAFRIRREALRQAMADDQVLRETLDKYSHFSVLALAQTAACNRLHHLEERCCRWLLIAHDSARSDTFQLTQEFLAMMLGVQRARISVTASSMQKAGLIEYRHGQVTIANRARLHETACECYDAMRAEYDKLFGKPKKDNQRMR